jgi:cell division protein ZapA
MSDSNHLVTVNIFDRDYKIKCQPDEAHQLQEAARILDQQMRSSNQASTSTNAERLAVVTALNMSHELARLKQQIAHLTNKVRNALATEEEIAV